MHSTESIQEESAAITDNVANSFIRNIYRKVIIPALIVFTFLESLFLFLSMKTIFKKGDKKTYVRVVGEEDTAAFESGRVHPVYSTFALARDAEWTCRLFVLEMKEADEEGIGTFITVNHQSPALIGQSVQFEAEVESIHGNEIICGYRAMVRDRLIATGRQGQKVLKKNKINDLFEKLKRG